MKIQKYINDRNKYLVDYTYQRPEDAWSTEDKQCLIDTILKNEPMPIFFVNYKTEEDKFYIVDGQQRLFCIRQFYDNEIKLNGKFSGKERDGQTFNGKNGINDEDKQNFLDYELSIKVLEDYDDERIRLIFSRLQRGKPLSLGERLNAKPGKIVDTMRELTKMPFMSKSIGINRQRYGIYPDIARILFYEKYGAKNSNTEELYKFFDDFPDLDKKSKEYKNAISVLNFLEECFPAEPGNYQYFSKHAWVFAVYTMIRELKQGYSLKGKEEIIRNFIVQFHSTIYDETRRSADRNYQRFYDNIRGGWSEKIIKLRMTILMNKFLEKNTLEELDDRRQISDEEKIALFTTHKECERCGKPFKDYREPEYHHKKMYSEGGKTEKQNIMVLCSKCHDIIHGKAEIELPSEEEKEDVE